MKKISVDAFLKEYSVAAKQNGSAMESFIKKHIVNKYIPFLEKSVICDGIIDACSYIKDGDNKIVKINSTNRYLFFTMKLIESYTDIEFTIDEENNIATEYDKLNEVGAISVLISAIPESEYSEFSTILNMKMDDLMDNDYSVTALLYNLKNSLSISEDIINSVLENIQDNQ